MNVSNLLKRLRRVFERGPSAYRIINAGRRSPARAKNNTLATGNPMLSPRGIANLRLRYGDMPARNTVRYGDIGS